MLLPVLGTGCLNAQKLSKNDAFDILTKWEGKWNNSDESMTWNYIDFSNNGINGKIIENFSSNSIIKINTVMKDKTGKTLLRVNSTKKRI